MCIRDSNFVVGLEDPLVHRQTDRPRLSAHLRFLFVDCDRYEVKLVAAQRRGRGIATDAICEWLWAAPAQAAVGARDGPRKLVDRQHASRDRRAVRYGLPRHCLLYTSP